MHTNLAAGLCSPTELGAPLHLASPDLQRHAWLEAGPLRLVVQGLQPPAALHSWPLLDKLELPELLDRDRSDLSWDPTGRHIFVGLRGANCQALGVADLLLDTHTGACSEMQMPAWYSEAILYQAGDWRPPATGRPPCICVYYAAADPNVETTLPASVPWS